MLGADGTGEWRPPAATPHEALIAVTVMSSMPGRVTTRTGPMNREEGALLSAGVEAIARAVPRGRRDDVSGHGTNIGAAAIRFDRPLSSPIGRGVVHAPAC